MMAYNAFDKNGNALTYKAVECFVKKTIDHQNIADQGEGGDEKGVKGGGTINNMPWWIVGDMVVE